MIISEIEIERLQPEKMWNMIERIQKAEPSFSTFRFLFAISSRVLMSAEKKQILKEGFKAFSWVFEFHFYDTYEQSHLHFHGLMYIKLPMHH